MAFRKRNVRLESASNSSLPESALGATNDTSKVKVLPTGLRPSPVDGRLTTSTGASTLDERLAGHAGLVMGSSLLIEEQGATDFAGALLRFYAAQGLVNEERVHVIGLSNSWGRELPGLQESKMDPADQSSSRQETSRDKMKIAWRYERLGEFGARQSPRGGAVFLFPAVPDDNFEFSWNRL